MRLLAISGLALVLLLVSLSSYLRLDHSGIGCAPWPDCYGNIGVDDNETTVGDAYERLVAEAREPLSWTRPLHRLVASVLGLLVLGMTAVSVLQRRYRLLSAGLLLLTVFLAWLGIYSEGLHSPAVVMGNLGGGFAMLALFGWLIFDMHRESPAAQTQPKARRWTGIALLAVCMQIALGGLTSANFAANACSTFPDCMGAWLPGNDVVAAFDLTRSHEINDAGYVVAGPERASVHQLHRLFALLVAGLVITAGVLGIRSNRNLLWPVVAVVSLVVAEVAVGIAAVLTNIPIIAAVAHNWLAALLLLALLYMRARLL